MVTRKKASRGPAGMIPPLQDGDRLTRAEFERRYEAMPDLKKAELIEGVVYVGSPVNHRYHGQPHIHIAAWAAVYAAATTGVEASDNATVRLGVDTEPQPDVFLRIETECGGRSRLSEQGYVEGPPELVVEVAASSAMYDLREKLRAYERLGVLEYVAWVVPERRLRWLELREGRYEERTPDADGVIRSATFPGLWLAVEALLAGDYMRVLSVLQDGLASPEHGAFAARLAQRRGGQG